MAASATRNRMCGNEIGRSRARILPQTGEGTRARSAFLRAARLGLGARVPIRLVLVRPLGRGRRRLRRVRGLLRRRSPSSGCLWSRREVGVDRALLVDFVRFPLRCGLALRRAHAAARTPARRSGFLRRALAVASRWRSAFVCPGAVALPRATPLPGTVTPRGATCPRRRTGLLGCRASRFRGLLVDLARARDADAACDARRGDDGRDLEPEPAGEDATRSPAAVAPVPTPAPTATARRRLRLR